ncbi:MAG: glycosyltransferase family 4 protein [Chloroflexi bacterium]|nr:glycosyltransferase family 4 protein [Chloroflexota bacterium]
MRVVHITRRFVPMVGGIERYVQSVATGQARLGHEVTVVTIDRDVIGDIPGRLPRLEMIDGVRVVRIPGVGNRRFAVGLRPDIVIRELRRADVVHHHDLRFMTGVVTLAARALGRPLLLHTHGLLFHTMWAFWVKKLTVRLYFGPLLRLTRARVVASSQPDRDLLLGLAPYLETLTMTFENATVLAPLLALSRDAQPGLVVTPGRVARHKGLEDLVRALGELSATPWRLEISGSEDREERRRLEAIVSSLGLRDRVRFMGGYSDEEHREQLSRAALCVFPSEHEGFGLAMLEAMAAGVPLLARDIPAHRSVLGADLTDRLVRIGRPADLAKAIEHELSATPEAIQAVGQRLRERAAAFDISRLLDQIERLYGEMGLPSLRGRDVVPET